MTGILSSIHNFLIEREPITWHAPKNFPTSLTPVNVYMQDSPNGLEVAVATALSKPSNHDIQQAWQRRRGNRAAPVLLVIFHPSFDRLKPSFDRERVSVCGPYGEHPPIQRDVEISQVERLADVALNEPDYHAAARFLLANLPELNTPIPGLRNVGLLATHELRKGVPHRSDWTQAVNRVSKLNMLGLRGRRLVEALGFTVENLSTNTWKLTVNGQNQAVAVFCDDGESFEAPAKRFGGVSPVSSALVQADQQNVNWVVLTRAAEIRLYATKADVGVGGKGRAETFVELNLTLLPKKNAGYLDLLFAAKALKPGGTFGEILTDSGRFAADLAGRLRERVYFETVPALASAVAKRLGSQPNAAQRDKAYEKVMMILFRLLFVAYAEDKDLLPYRTNNRYQDKSLQHMASRFSEDQRNGHICYDTTATSMWDDVRQLWQAVDTGNTAWGVPAYNGGLFSSDPKVSELGAEMKNLQLTDAEFAPALSALLVDKELVDKDKKEIGPVDFRSLSVREFGTIYEGLLELRLALASSDLTISTKNKTKTPQYVPAQEGDAVEVSTGGVYLCNRSGVRKSTGSYFTKPFAVEHLLDHALETALADHIARLNMLLASGNEAAVAETFFDFRCADIAMGSGHFLVAALDRIEARLSVWLTENPIAQVNEELLRLRDTALDSLGELAKGVEIETGSLLRRQVARRCVYGVDKNPVAVELARLAIWVHTFVPGLPLSFLDHNLVCGDSLTGVGTLDEVMAAFDPDVDPDAPSLFRSQLLDSLDRSRSALQRLARTSDATKAEINDAREAHNAASQAVDGARALFNLITAHRTGVCTLPEKFDESVFVRESRKPAVAEVIKALKPLHFPAVFPEVFLRDYPGFDCVLGNPPWEKVVADREVWWGLHLPGVRSLPVSQRRARINKLEEDRPDLAAEFKADKEHADSLKQVLRITFPNLGSGQTDLYKAFSWANLELARQGGRIGLVLPRSAISDPGMANWRLHITENHGGGGERESKSAGMRGCTWLRSSITRAGCSKGFTIPIQ